eukprot:TRINITY_DN8086_c1_g1_i2.p1 TRINITY_DN8086_c1_g1~~TRINITY_DN8086_c1_g1_i2.p1  ORF type:complete len:128 (-),score=1.68 TRINITY_DN8086_c1_g1_i2:130-513(-)
MQNINNNIDNNNLKDFYKKDLRSCGQTRQLVARFFSTFQTSGICQYGQLYSYLKIYIYILLLFHMQQQQQQQQYIFWRCMIKDYKFNYFLGEQVGFCYDKSVEQVFVMTKVSNCLRGLKINQFWQKN